MKINYILLLAIIGVTSFYLYKNETLRTKFLGMIHQVAPELNKSTLYKWKNSKGEWQITDKPPANGIKFTTITSQDQINVMPSPISKEKK